jgi:predicted nucleic acid-binding protein
LIDINVWLALTWDRHAPAARWFGAIDAATLVFCRFTMLGFLRLLTNRQVMGDSTVTVSEALGLYGRWRRDPRVELAPEPHAAEVRFRLALRPHGNAAATKPSRTAIWSDLQKRQAQGSLPSMAVWRRTRNRVRSR